MRIVEAYHDGELLVQQRTGETSTGQRNAAAISDSIIAGALKFIGQQSMVVLSSIDTDGAVWASVAFGAPGFMQAPDEHTVLIDTREAWLDATDTLWTRIKRDPRIGMLVIELGSRRRLRINGHVHRVGDDQLRVKVDEAYPNCPKYIQRRHLVGHWGAGPRGTAPIRQGTTLTRDHKQLLDATDTFFVASAHPRGHLDVSHRGGAPGFVQFVDDTTLRIPDYEGNGMFNTLGNFVVHPHAGLAIIDFAGRRLLQLIGRPVIHYEMDDPGNTTGGTLRFWDLEVTGWVEQDVPFDLTWELQDYSPHNPQRDA